MRLRGPLLIAIGALLAFRANRPAPASTTPVLADVLSRYLSPAEAAQASLPAWLAARDGLVRSVELASFGGLRGLAASRVLADDSLVLSLPLRTTLSALTFTGAPQLRSAVAGLPLDDHSAVLLLYELLLGAASPWHLYLSMLPRAFEHLPAFYAANASDGAPALWTRLGALAPLVASQQAHLADTLPHVEAAVRRLPRGSRLLTALRPGELPVLASWAWAVARTRMLDQELQHFPSDLAAFALAGVTVVPVLMPFLDMLNHAERDTPACNLRLSSPGSRIELHAVRPLARGEELRFSYRGSGQEEEADELCDVQWLSHYGFSMEDGRPERDCWHFRLSLPSLRRLPQPPEVPRGAATRLRQAGLDTTIETVLTGSGEIYIGLLQWLAVALASSSPDKPDALAWQLLVETLRAARLELAEALAAAEHRSASSGGDGPLVRRIAAGSLRAAAAAEEQALLGWEQAQLIY